MTPEWLFVQFFPFLPSLLQSGIDKSGPPRNLAVKQQNGHVFLVFEDNSKCEQAYALERIDGGVTESFAPNFYFFSENACDDVVQPGRGYTDDLSLSELTVGKSYQYCATAVAEHYMADASGLYSPFLKGGTQVCKSHIIEWVSFCSNKRRLLAFSICLNIVFILVSLPTVGSKRQCSSSSKKRGRKSTCQRCHCLVAFVGGGHSSWGQPKQYCHLRRW